MGIFICDNCAAIENTSFGIYWERNEENFEDEALAGKALCSACAPLEYSDGTPTRCRGQWHGRFAKTIATEEEVRRLGFDYFVYLGPFAHLSFET